MDEPHPVTAAPPASPVPPVPPASLVPPVPPVPLALAALITLTVLPTDTARAAAIEPGITLTSDSTSVYAGDGVTIEIESVGLIEPLDTAPLHRDADLVRETGGTRIGVIGGQVVEVQTRRMEFLPRGEGRAFFGPLSGESVGGTVRSNALSIEVLPPPDIDWQPGEEDLDLRFSLSNDAPIVGERLVADLVLRHRHAIADETITLPTFAGFDVLPVFERRRTIVEEEGTGWRQIAWRWLLFAQRSGPVAIEPAVWHGEMIRSRTQRGRFERRVEPATLVVAPAPEDADTWWLPAADVMLAESWSRDIRTLSAGEEIVRTITLVADGVLARQLPTVVPLESRAITSTPIGERREQQLIEGELTSSATFEFRMHARSPVPVFLDTVRVGWWDTTTREAREAIVPARRIDVGLPERADLLEVLALSESRASRVRLWLRSRQDRETALWITLGVLAAGLAVLLVRGARGRSGRRDEGSDHAAPSVLPPL